MQHLFMFVTNDQIIPAFLKIVRKISLVMVKHIKKNSSAFINCLWHGFSSVEGYLNESCMKYVGVWASEVEIQAAADLFGVHVFMYSRNKWF